MPYQNPSVRKLGRFLILIPVLLLAFGLRVCDLAEANIWWDEGIGVWVARLPILEGIRWTATDSHPPLHYIVLHAWRLLVGEGEYVLRFPSVVAGLFTVVFTYRLARLLGGATTGVLAAVLVALSRFSISWSQEIRMYGLATTLSTGSLWAAVLLWRRSLRTSGAERRCPTDPPSSGRQTPTATRRLANWPWHAWLTYVAFTAASLFTLYLTGTVVVVTNLAFLVIGWCNAWNRKLLWSWVTAQLAVTALIVPWLSYALPQMHSLSTDEPFDPGFFLQLYATMLTVGSPLNLERNAPWIITVSVGLLIGTVATGRSLTGRHQTNNASPDPHAVKRAGLAMLVAGLLLPPLAVVLVALPSLNLGFSRSIAPRYLLPLSACYAVLLAWGIDSLRQQGYRVRLPQRSTQSAISTRSTHTIWWTALAVSFGTMAVLAALSGLSTYYRGRTRRDDYVTIAEVLRGHRHNTDAVVLYVDRDWPIFAAHYAGARHDLAYGAELSDPELVDSILSPIWDTSSAIWLVSTPESLQADPAQAVPQWLTAHANVTRTVVSGENALTLYARSELDARVRETALPGYTLPNRVATAHSLVGAHIPLPRYKTGDTLHLGLYWIPPVPQNASVVIDNGTSRLDFSILSGSADLNIARTQVDIPLTSELTGGIYKVVVTVPGYIPTQVGTFTLVSADTGDAVAADSIANRAAVKFGPSIELVGYAIPITEVAPGEAVALTLYWRTTEPLTARYKVFTHLLGKTFNAETGNFLWGQQDNEPGNGQRLTTQWAKDAIIVDDYRIPVDTQAPPGPYQIEVGMYGLVDGIRLPATARGLTVAGDAVFLTTVMIVPK